MMMMRMAWKTEQREDGHQTKEGSNGADDGLAA